MTVTRLPGQYYDDLGKIKIRKGYLPVQDHTGKQLTKYSLFTWDVVPKCIQDLCPADSLCDEARTSTKCTVTATYLRSAAQTILQNFTDVLDEPSFYRVGMHLMPAYRTLCKLKIEELGVGRIVTYSAQGKPMANPIYREIRETIKLIEMLWERLGLTKYQIIPPGLDLEPQMKTKPENPNEPVSYYSRLEAGLIKTKTETESESARVVKPKLILRLRK